MEKKFKISLLAVSVLMGAGLTSMTAFADTAKDIQALVNPLTQTDKAGAAKTYHDAKETADKYQKALADVEAAKAKETKDTDPITAFNKAEAAKNAAKLDFDKLTNEHSIINDAAISDVKSVYGTTETIAKKEGFFTNPASNFYGRVDLTQTTAVLAFGTLFTAGDTTSSLGKYIKSEKDALEQTEDKASTYRKKLDTAIGDLSSKLTAPAGKKLDGTNIDANSITGTQLGAAIDFYRKVYQAGKQVQLLDKVVAENEAALKSQITAMVSNAKKVYGDNKDAASLRSDVNGKAVATAVKAYDTELAKSDSKFADQITKAGLLLAAINTANTGLVTPEDKAAKTVSTGNYSSVKTNYDNAVLIYKDAQSKAVTAAGATAPYDLGSKPLTKDSKLIDGTVELAAVRLQDAMSKLFALAEQKADTGEKKQALEAAKLANDEIEKTRKEAKEAFDKATVNVTGIIKGLNDAATQLSSAKTAFDTANGTFEKAKTGYNKVKEVEALNKLTPVDLTSALTTYARAIDGVISTGGSLDTTILGDGTTPGKPLADYKTKLTSGTDASKERTSLIDTAAQVTTAKVGVLTTLAKGDLKGDFTNSKAAISKAEEASKAAAAAATEYTKAVDAFNAALAKAINTKDIDFTDKTGDAAKAPAFKDAADELAYLKAKANLLNAAGYDTAGTLTIPTDKLAELVLIDESNPSVKNVIKTDFYSLTTKDKEGHPTGVTHEPAALQAKTDADGVLKSIDTIVAGYRKNVAHSMQQLSYMVRVRATGAEAKTYTDAFAALATNDGIGAFGTTIEALKASRNDVKTKEEGTGIEKVTTAGDKDHVLYLGGLTLNEIINPIVDDKKDINRYRAIILNDKSLPKTSFSSEELKSLNLGSKGDPVFNTVLNLEAPQLSADFTKPNTLTIGSADIKDSTGKVTKKGNVTDIYASAYKGMHTDKSPDNKAPENSGAAVRIGGDLLDGNVGYLDAKGKLAMIAGEAGKKPVTASLLGDKTLGADSIALHNLNINNIVTLDSLKAKVEKDRAAYNKQLDELVEAKLKLTVKGTPEPEKNDSKKDGDTKGNKDADAAKDNARKEIAAEVEKAQKLAKSSAEYKSLPAAVKEAVNALDQLNRVEKVIQDNGSTAIGLLVDSSTKTQVLKGPTGLAATNGSQYNIFTAQPLTQAPENPNITLDNVNILVENAAGKAIGIDVTGEANNLQINGGSVIAKAYNANGGISGGTALAFESSRGNNKVTFKDVGNIIGEIRDERGNPVGYGFNPASTTPNTVVLDHSNWFGDASSNKTPIGKNFLTVELANGTVWAGKSSRSPDLIIRKDATWYVMGDSSVNSLKNDGSLTLDLVPQKDIVAKYQKTYIGNSQLDPRVAAVLTVEQGMDTAGALKDGNPTQTTINIHAGAYSPKSLDLSTGIGLADNYRYGSLVVENQPITGGGILNLIMDSGGAEPAVTAEGRLKAAEVTEVTDEGKVKAANATTEHSFIRYLDKGVTVAGGAPVASDVKIPAVITEEGVYQYRSELTAVNQEGYRNVFFTRTGQLSNSAATVAGLAAAPASVAAMEGDALGKHITSLRHSESSGVWISYYGGSNQNTLSAGPQYDLKTNGVMLGVDTSMADWMAGIAFTSGKASLSVLNSSGSVNNYGAQFWLSRHYSNGVFVNGVAQFGHYANKAKVSMIDGTPARGEYSSNGYGLSAKVGYAYRHASGFYAEPYVQAGGRAFSGAAYTLNNGMNVSSTDYKSFVGEIGTDLGYTVPTGAGYFKPYLHLAVLDEFANGNSVRANNIDLQNNINGAALRIGVGGEVKLMQNLGGYLSYDYTKGSNTERPWQVNLGINYSW